LLIALLLLLPLQATAEQKKQEFRLPEWKDFPRMRLERQYAGPLQDTIIQRWSDPVDGTVCYIYLPINAQHAPRDQTGYVQYGSNIIGSISCFASAAAAKKRPATNR
jgi:hypothetical protein